MNRKFLVIVNTLTLVAVIIINAMAGSGNIKDTTVGEVSDKYNSLFAPAGYAFSIWGLIYLGLILFEIFQWYTLFKKQNLEYIDKISGFFILSNVANFMWIILWLNEFIGLSVIMMCVLLLSLIAIVMRGDMELKKVSFPVLAFVYWPFTIYLGWIIVATVANVAAYLNISWNGEPLTPELWTIIMIVVAAIIYLLLIYKRNMREAAGVGIWALIAIAVRHWNEITVISYSALILALIILSAIILHAYKNRKHLPLVN